MAETKTNKAPKQEANTAPAQEPELNEVDGDPMPGTSAATTTRAPSSRLTSRAR